LSAKDHDDKSDIVSLRVQPENLADAISTGRKNLFSSWSNSLLTIVCLWLMWELIPPLLNWAFLQANWVGSTRADCTKAGACWVFIHERFGQFMYGLYPHEQRWRINLALVIGCSLSRVLEKAASSWTLYCLLGGGLSHYCLGVAVRWFPGTGTR
jgi:hypothetical protein